MGLSYEERQKEKEKAAINARAISAQMQRDQYLNESARIRKEQNELKRQITVQEAERRRAMEQELTRLEGQLKAIDDARQAIKERYRIFAQFLPDEERILLARYHEKLMADVKGKIDTQFISSVDSIQLYIVKYLQSDNDFDFNRIVIEQNFLEDFVHYILIECIEYQENQEKLKEQEEAAKKAEEARQRKQIEFVAKEAANQRRKKKMGKRALCWLIVSTILMIITVICFSSLLMVPGFICLYASGGCAMSAFVHFLIRVSI